MVSTVPGSWTGASWWEACSGGVGAEVLFLGWVVPLLVWSSMIMGACEDEPGCAEGSGGCMASECFCLAQVRLSFPRGFAPRKVKERSFFLEVEKVLFVRLCLLMWVCSDEGQRAFKEMS